MVLALALGTSGLQGRLIRIHIGSCCGWDLDGWTQQTYYIEGQRLRDVTGGLASLAQWPKGLVELSHGG